MIGLRNDPGKSGSIISRACQKAKLFAEPIQEDRLPRKTSRINIAATVPQTDTGEQGEKPQVYERTFVKELGKIAAVI